MNAAIYLRVSSKRQADADRASLPVQLADCRRFCEDRGFVEVRGRGDYRLSWQIPTSA